MPPGVLAKINDTLWRETHAHDETGPGHRLYAPNRQRLGLRNHSQEENRGPRPSPEIWAIVGEFCAIKDWHPAVAQCEETKEGDVTFRTLTLKDGGKIKEKLTGTEDLAYTYEIVESPLPVKHYKSKLWLEVDDEPDRSVILWQSDFDANGKSDEEAEKIITGIFKDGVKGIKEKAIAAYDAKHPDAKESDDDNDDKK